MRDAMDDVKWVIGILIVIGLVWLALGGPKRDSGGLFINPPAPLGTGGTYGRLPGDGGVVGGGGTDGGGIDRGSAIEEEIEKIELELERVREELEKAQERAESSVWKGVVSLDAASARSEDIEREHVRIRVSSSAKEKIPVSDWRLVSPITGRSIPLGEGTYLPFSGQVNTQQHIFLSPGDKVIVSTGRSPIGTSFRLNSCTGYFEQFQDFSPFLPRECPRPEDEAVVFIGPGGFNDQCIDFIESLPKCTLHIKALPPGLSPSCQEYINKDVNYNGCVKFHKDDADFYKNEWRVFLGRGSTIWKKKREVIKLLDEKGKTVDVVSY